MEKDAIQVVDKAEDIKNATREQEIAANEIVKTVSTITELSQSIASGPEELAASSQVVAQMAEILRTRLDYFKM